MRKFEEFFKRIKIKEDNNIPHNKKDNNNESIEIEIEGNIELFKEEKTKNN